MCSSKACYTEKHRRRIQKKNTCGREEVEMEILLENVHLLEAIQNIFFFFCCLKKKRKKELFSIVCLCSGSVVGRNYVVRYQTNGRYAEKMEINYLKKCDYKTRMNETNEKCLVFYEADNVVQSERV